MNNNQKLEKTVLLANKEFYDKTAHIYHQADGRRSSSLEKWICSTLKGLSVNYDNDSFLDLGCGTGFMMKCARPYFKNIYGIDISSQMLKQAKKFGKVYCGDIAKLPYKNNSFNVICCFSTLHHCYNLKKIFQEALRVLKKNGCFYTNHDLEANFVKNFGLFLKIYRLIKNPFSQYFKRVKNLNKSLWKKTEYRSQGIDANKAVNDLKTTGFQEIKTEHHWFGLSNILNIIFNQKKFPLGLAPLLSIKAVKK